MAPIRHETRKKMLTKFGEEEHEVRIEDDMDEGRENAGTL